MSRRRMHVGRHACITNAGGDPVGAATHVRVVLRPRADAGDLQEVVELSAYAALFAREPPIEIVRNARWCVLHARSRLRRYDHTAAQMDHVQTSHHTRSSLVSVV